MQITHVKKSPQFKKLRLFDTIFDTYLLAELKQRRIPESLAAKYLQQICMQDLQQPECKLNGFAFANDRGGYHVTLPDTTDTFQTSLPPHVPTTFKARKSDKLFVFEDGWDFLGWMAMQDMQVPEHHTIVLNSLSLCEPVTSGIITIREVVNTVMLFMSNSDDGRQAAKYMDEGLTNAGFTTRIMGSLYQGYKNFAHYWSKDPDAKKIVDPMEAQLKRLMSKQTPSK